ncbi:MAG: TRAP transporter large permease [Clostridia bacterium]|nr:TRAP transporter large permease [Clostridia bacterium]
MLGSILCTFLASLVIGIPIAVALILTVVIACLMNPALPIDGIFIFKNLVLGLNVYAILAVPLFVMAGVIMSRGGISKRLFNFFAYFIGKLTGGLPSTTVATCLFYGAISGSGPATTAAVGMMSVPYLTDKGYEKDFTVALVAVAGGLGVIIPPSVPFIMYGTATNTVSVGGMFIAGILPGLLIGACLMIYCYFRCKRTGEDKQKLTEAYNEMHKAGFLSVFKESFLALLMPVIILGGIYGGIMTPTEAAAVSVLYALILSMFVYKTISIKDIPSVLKESVESGVPINLVVAAASIFTRCLTLLQIPQEVTMILSGFFHTKVVFLLGMNLLLLFVGMIMDTTSAILILTPLLLPLAMSLGINPYHFGVIMVVNLAIGFVTPPVGVNLYVASSFSGLNVMTIARKAVPFMIVFFIALMIITFVPQISTLLLGF